jgi:hypothetical protein
MAAQVGTTLRKAPLGTLVEMLKRQNDVKFDAVVPATSLRYVDGLLHIAGAAVRFVDVADGDLQAVSCDAVLAPTDLFEDGVSHRLDIPRQYLRRMRDSGVLVDVSEVAAWELGKDGDEDERPLMPLLDATVNAWLAAQGTKRYLVRAFNTDDPDEVGIARALLSNRFGFIDHYDVLLAAIDGARQAGIDMTKLVVECDLSERNMRVRMDAPEIALAAPELLANYRSPFDPTRTGREYPLINSGICLGNSETGGGAFTACPRLTYQVCTNGQNRTVDAHREVHVGSTLEDGIVRWSAETHRRQLELITAKTKDLVGSWLDVEYLRGVVREMSEKYQVPVVDAPATIERVAKQHSFTESEARDILDCFIKGGDLTAGGVMQAVTASAQNVADPDRAAYYEDSAFDVLTTAAQN